MCVYIPAVVYSHLLEWLALTAPTDQVGFRCALSLSLVRKSLSCLSAQLNQPAADCRVLFCCVQSCALGDARGKLFELRNDSYES